MPSPVSTLSSDIQSVPVPADPAAHAEERTRVMRDGFINYSGVAVSNLVSLITVPLMLRGLGAELYGVWIAALSLVGMLQAVDLGLSCAVTREIAAARKENRAQAAPFVVTAGILFLVLGIVGCIALAMFGTRWSRHLGTGTAAQLSPLVFALLGISLVGSEISKFAIAMLEGIRRFDVANAVAILSALLRGAGVIFLMLEGEGLVAVALWYACTEVIVSLAGLGIAARLAPVLWSRRLASWEQLRSPLHFGLMSQINSGLTKVVWESAPLIVGLMLGPGAAVPLYVGQRFPFAISILNDRAASVLFPAASEIGGDAREHLHQLLQTGMRAVLIVAVPCCLLLWVLAPSLLQAWMGVTLPEAAWVMRITTIAVLADAAGAAAFQVLWGRGQVYRLAAILGAMALTGVGLTVTLLPRLGTIGAAWGFVAAAALGAFCANRVLAEPGRSALRLCIDSLRGILLPALASAALAAGLAHLLPATRLFVLLEFSLAGLVYLAGMLLVGARDEERRLLREAVAAVHRWLPAVFGSARQVLKRIPGFRSAWSFAIAVSETIRNPWASGREFDREFTTPDPWNFSGAFEQQRFRSALHMLDGTPKGSFTEVLEVGCAEGMFTEMLHSRCRSLLAVDFSEVALQRATQRCSVRSGLTFQHWDLRRDGVPGEFDLVVAMCVLEYLRRPSDFYRCREKLVHALKPGGYLLASHARQSTLKENSRWAKWLLRDGKWINVFLAKHPALEIVCTDTGHSYINCLFRKR